MKHKVELHVPDDSWIVVYHIPGAHESFGVEVTSRHINTVAVLIADGTRKNYYQIEQGKDLRVYPIRRQEVSE